MTMTTWELVKSVRCDHIPGHVTTAADSGGTTSGFRLSAGMLLQDQSGIVWRIVQVGNPETNPLTAESVNATNRLGAPFKTNLFNLVQQFGRFFLTETGRAIELTAPTRMTFSARQLTVGESGTLFPTGSTGSAPAFSSTREAAELQFQQQRQLDAEAFARQKELDRIRAENERLLQARTDLRGIAETAAAIRQREREGLLGLYQETQNILADTLGKDVIRGAIRGQGGVTRGVTPLAGFRRGVAQTGQEAQTRLGELGPLAAPNLGLDLPGTEAEIERFRRFAEPRDIPTLPTAGPFVGLAGGGTIGGDMLEGEVLAVDGQPAVRRGTSKVAVLVGEGNIDGDEEVVVHDRATGQTDVIPLAGGAAGGASFGDFSFDPGTVRQALSPIFENLGFSFTPTFRPANLPSGNLGMLASGVGGATGLRRLGIRPRVIRRPGQDLLFLEGNTLRPFTFEQFKQFGFNPQDVVTFDQPRSFEQFLRNENLSVGAPLTAAPPEIERGVSGRTFPRSGEPVFIREGPAGVRGLAIPLPRTFASLIRSVSPSTRSVIASALGLVDFSREDIEEELRFFTPGGTATRPRAALLA